MSLSIYLSISVNISLSFSLPASLSISLPISQSDPLPPHSVSSPSLPRPLADPNNEGGGNAAGRRVVNVEERVVSVDVDGSLFLRAKLAKGCV